MHFKQPVIANEECGMKQEFTILENVLSSYRDDFFGNSEQEIRELDIFP